MRIIFGILLCVFSLWGFNEDDAVNEALNAVDAKNYNQARDLYLVLYEESGKIEYLRESILVSGLLDDPNGAINLIRFFYKKNPQYDLEVEKVLADSYLKLGDVKNSILTIEKIKEKENSPVVHEILGGLYMETKRFDEALKELNTAYNSTHSEASLEKIIAIYLNTQKTGLIGDLLNTHLEKYGCSQDLCKRSIEFYIKTKQISRVEKILAQIESRSPTIQNATNLIAVYAYQKKFDEALKIAKKYPLNRNILLELYIGNQDFKNASQLSEVIYQEEKKPEYLILSQMYLFEALKPKISKDELLSILSKLKKGIEEFRQESIQTTSMFANYLNFAGYLMIDYDIAIKEGIGYVQEALKIEPNNIEFIDSLAWGYYKLGQCDQAKKEFEKIPQEKILDNADLKEHKKSLSACVSQ